MKEKSLRTIFCLAVSFLVVGCKKDIITNDPVAFVYPSEGIANIRVFTKSCPVTVSTTITTVPASELDGWVCIPAENAQKYRREFEKDCR